MPKWIESEQQKLILDYLHYNGFVCKIELSGKPKKENGKIKLIPFKNKYFKLFMSDIYFLYKGETFWFEVKDPKDIEWLKTKILLNRLDEPIKTRKHQRIIGQYRFLEDIIKNGAYGGFVSNLTIVKAIICEKPKKVCLDSLL